MLLFTVFFLLISLYKLFKGKLFFDAIKKSSLLQLEMATASESEKKKLSTENAGFIFSILIRALFIVIAEFIYLINAIKIDSLKYPTLLQLGYLIITTAWAFSKGSKRDLSTEENREKFKAKIYSNKRFGFKDVLLTIIDIIYYGYMFYLLAL